MTSKTKELNGVRFTAAAFSAVEALRLKAYLVRTFGPAIGEALGAFKDVLKAGTDIGNASIDGGAVAVAVEKLMEQLSEDSFIALIRRLFANVTAVVAGKDGKSIAISFSGNDFDAAMELAFAGHVFSVYSIIALVLEVNYPDFFDKVRGFGPRIQKIVTSASAEEAGKAN